MWHRRFLFLWAGQTLANLGDVFYIVAFISVIYAISGSVMYTAFVPVVILSAQSVSGLTAPLLFRRLSLPSMLVLSQALKTCLLAAAAVLVDRTAGTNGQAIWLLFGLGGLIAFMDGWANPARNALVPQLVEREQLIRANGLLATSDQTVHFAGWAAGGLLVAFLGASAVLWGTVAAYVLASLAMLAVKPEKAAPDMTVVEPPQENWLTGWKAIRDVPLLRQLVALDVVMGVSGAVWIAAILLPYVLEALGRGEEWWGYINAGYLLGSILGGTLLLKYADKMNRQLYRWLLAGVGGAAAMTLLFGSTTYPLAALLFSFALGPFLEIALVSKQTILQQETETPMLPYVLSAKGTIDALVFGLSSLLMGALAQWLGPRAVYLLSAVLLAGAAFFVWRLRQKQLASARKQTV
ncbi:MFS transporter [Brevibacillus sp. HD3.3A]|uniref:MFS transporter n=1 Tax=Brevibacillus sp. HD3.3A TaxID=2738979 RepID=UPI00156AAC3C|nr:MFS transporter [Brevibacillus sp. HD3.3A]UED70056.1 MFS transporter [Brevibacillus sp. HD3.3A]